MEPSVVQLLMEINQTLSNVDSRLAGLERAVLGNGQEGLKQEVEALQASKNWLWGAGSALAGLLGYIEYILHRGK